MSHGNYERAGNWDTDSESNCSMITIQMHLTLFFNDTEVHDSALSPFLSIKEKKSHGI